MRHWVAQLVRRVVWQLVRKAMTGEQLRQAVRRGDAAKVSTLLSTQAAQSFINYQDEHGRTLLHDATIRGHETVTEQLIVACCSVEGGRRRQHTGWHRIHPVLLSSASSTFK
jgi:hypothetical protein